MHRTIILNLWQFNRYNLNTLNYHEESEVPGRECNSQLVLALHDR